MAAVLALLAAPAVADVKTTTRTTYYKVAGTSAKALVRSLRSHPIAGDHGAAYANIRPSYSLNVATTERGAVCLATDVDVRISFRLTLPQSASRLSGRTKAAWDSFIDFATRHEKWHERSYTDCARRFVTRARRVSAPSCSAVRSEVRRMFDKAKRDCEAVQRDFDRQERGRLASQRLFRMGGG